MTRRKSADKTPTIGGITWGGHLQGSSGYRRVLAALASSGIATFAQLYSVQGLLPQIPRDLGITAAQTALSVSAATVGLAVVLATLLGLLVPAAPTFEALLLLRLLEGAALGGIPALAIAYLTEETSPQHAGAAAGAYVAGTTLGGLSGRLLAVPVADLAAWRMGTLAVSLRAAAEAVGFLLLAPKPRGFVPAAAPGGFGQVLRKLLQQLHNKSLLAPIYPRFLADGLLCQRLQLPGLLVGGAALSPASFCRGVAFPGVSVGDGFFS